VGVGRVCHFFRRGDNDVDAGEAIGGKLFGSALMESWFALNLGDDEEIDVA